MRRTLAGASAALVAALLAGCAGIPSSGSVHAGRQQAPADSLELELLASGPQAGADQAAILRGFIDAATDARNNYQVARDFLTPAFADEWRPDQGATIDVLADREFRTIDAASMRVDVVPTASLGPNGEYQLAASQTPIPLTYDFEQVDGQWRISNAPPGILIESSNFTRVFRSHTLIFLDPTEQYAVPDVRWFAGREVVQTKVVRALLAGPVEWLRPGVVSAFPEEARLEADAVPVSGGVATVDLAGVSAEAPRDVQLMNYQLKTSLQGVRSVSDVELSLNDAIQNVPDLAVEPVVNPRVSSRPVVFDGAALGHLPAGGDQVIPLAGISPQAVALAPTGAAIGPGGDEVAVRNAEGVSRIRAGEDPVPLDPRDGLIVPAIDAYGAVWSVPGERPDELIVVPAEGATVQLAVPWIGTSIAALEVSRDGTRVIAMLAEGARTRFLVTAVERDEAGTPVALGPEMLELAHVDGTPLDATWLDDHTVASLTATAQGTQVITQTVGGLDTPRAGPEDGVQILGGNSMRDLRVRTAEGNLDTQSGLGWQVQASGIRFVSVQMPESPMR
ncbi:LpqB family beta-propeller domain-containing protein [Agromyces aerolatus]|uniref:LpqB family beta-propeller domain-containing protein n=1 Tax=Agromyces sp. LY-1074 TaxID=3074080 RepID=UPI002862DFC8|nr:MULTISPECIES: LpqB family beta-propeller domain-containing protein [unclassified Agromyces]MDR5699837.1 LpqB family beta-propeller domain-containing protein [Agromyces sp. LY-1074]MDR5706351.1 LpqB family beta-propeller domain-containing protein [Agromyces sp. LY-1358]